MAFILNDAVYILFIIESSIKDNVLCLDGELWGWDALVFFYMILLHLLHMVERNCPTFRHCVRYIDKRSLLPSCEPVPPPPSWSWTCDVPSSWGLCGGERRGTASCGTWRVSLEQITGIPTCEMKKNIKTNRYFFYCYISIFCTSATILDCPKIQIFAMNFFKTLFIEILAHF